MKPILILCCVACASALVAPAARVRPPRSRQVGTEGEGDAAPDAPPALPIDAAGEWNLDWVGGDADRGSWDARDVAGGALAFAACHLAALAACGADRPVAVRVVGAGLFVLVQGAAGTVPGVPLRRGLDAAAFGAGTRTGAVRVGGASAPWPLVAAGATAPLVLAAGLPLVLSAPPGAFGFDAARLPDVAAAAERVLVAPLTEGLVFQLWAGEACRRADLPYAPSVLGAGLLFGAWHGPHLGSAWLAVLGTYWAHLYAQTRTAAVPAASHALWNAYALAVAAATRPLP